jgi:hypothetical protein
MARCGDGRGAGSIAVPRLLSREGSTAIMGIKERNFRPLPDNLSLENLVPTAAIIEVESLALQILLKRLVESILNIAESRLAYCQTNSSTSLHNAVGTTATAALRNGSISRSSRNLTLPPKVPAVSTRPTPSSRLVITMSAETRFTFGVSDFIYVPAYGFTRRSPFSAVR